MFDLRVLIFVIVTLLVIAFAISEERFKVPKFSDNIIQNLRIPRLTGILPGDSTTSIVLNAKYTSLEKFWRYFFDFDPARLFLNYTLVNDSLHYIEIGGSKLGNKEAGISIEGYTGFVEIEDDFVVRGKGKVKLGEFEFEKIKVEGRISQGSLEFPEISGVRLRIFGAEGSINTDLGQIPLTNRTVLIDNFEGRMLINFKDREILLDGKISMLEIDGEKKLKIE